MTTPQDDIDELFYRTLRGKTVSPEQAHILEWAEEQLKPAFRTLLHERELRAIERYLTEIYGARCETKDTDDFPDLKKTDPQGRCACCEAWESYDEWAAPNAAKKGKEQL